MNKTLKWILIVAGSLVVIFLVFKWMNRGNDVVKVATAKADKRTIIETVNGNGKIYPEVEVKITPDISGQITYLKVQEGDSVKKGDVLAKIYADIYSLQRDQAASHVNLSSATVANSKAMIEALQANLNQAQQTYDRNKKLYDDKVISKSELEQYETALHTAQANYNAAEQNIKGLEASVQESQVGLTRANKDLSRTVLTAPMDGIISSLKVKLGERVSGNSFTLGTEMMTVADMSELEVRVDVGENDITKIQIDDSADVQVDAYNDRKFKGIVTKIASSASSGSGIGGTNDVVNYEVRIHLYKSSYADLADKPFPFRPGMNASADIKTSKAENVLSVPINAVTTRIKGTDKTTAEKKKQQEKSDNNADETSTTGSDEQDYVVFMVNKDGTVTKTIVTTGIQDMNYFEIRSGLNAGDEVVVEPYAVIRTTLKNGMKVKVIPKDKLFAN
jgi:HlyD family secretion protein